MSRSIQPRTAASSGESTMPTSGQRSTAAPRRSSRVARTSSWRASGTATTLPASTRSDSLDGAVIGERRLLVGVGEHLRRRDGDGVTRGNGLQTREPHDGARLDAIEVQIRIVLAQQPDRHVVLAGRQDPQRLAGLHDVTLDLLDLVRREEVVLDLLMVRAAALLERLRVDASELERQGLSEDDGFLERQRIEIAQPLRRNLEPIGVVAESLERLDGDLVRRTDRVVARIRSQNVLLDFERVD